MANFRVVTNRAGGRQSARRFLHAVAIALSLSPCFVSQPAAMTASDSAEVSVRETDGVYAVTARFQVPQPGATVLTVLTDYEGIPRFMPGVTLSVVRERSEDRVLVEQEAVSRMMMFSKRVFLMLEVAAVENSIGFRDLGGRSFQCYEGNWHVADGGGYTTISYQLRAKPSFDVPQFLLKRLLKRDSKEMIERLRLEIASRPSNVIFPSHRATRF